MSSTSELSSFAARLRESIVTSEWRARTSPASNPRVGEADFEDLTLELFALQFEHNTAYRRLCEARGARPDTVAHWTGIPAAPTSAFKEFDLSCLPVADRTAVFHSSGTTGQRPSRHYHNASSLALYEASLLRWFEAQFPSPIANSQLAILTPPPSQAPHSSLVHMFESIRRNLASGGSRFLGSVAEDGTWAIELEAAVEVLQKASAGTRPLLVFGTAFSFVHLLDHMAEQDLSFELPPGSRALETGGYKGRSRTLPKAELHALISQRLGIPPQQIICEYGMSELSSQAYDLEIGEHAAECPSFENSDVSLPLTPALSLREREDRRLSLQRPGATGRLAQRHATLPLPKGEGRGEGEQSVPPPCGVTSATASERSFLFPSWARVQIVSPETGLEVAEGETGLIRVFDLANAYSVMAIQTEDLGIRSGNGFTLTGRAILAEPRGCSLMAV